MNRRESLAALCALSTLGLTRSVHGQHRPPLIAVLLHGKESALHDRLDAFRDGLRDLGYAETRDYRLQVRWSDNRAERLPVLARELLAANPAVAVAVPVLSAHALHQESKTLPIVIASGAGALQLGLIASLRRPGGNVTGLTNQAEETTAKLFQILRELSPRSKRIVTLSSGLAVVEAQSRAESRTAAKAYGLSVLEGLAESPEKLQPLRMRCEREGCEALVVLIDPNLISFRADVIAFAAKLRIPAVYPATSYAEEGGLASYAADVRDMYRRAAGYVDKILKGAKPADLPVEQPTKFEFVVNVKTARELGITVPRPVLLRATRVIE